MEIESPYYFPASDSSYTSGKCKGITIFQYTTIQAMSALIKADPSMKPKDIAKLAIDHAEALEKQWEKK